MERVVDVIKEGEIIRMTEAKALEDDLFILRKVIVPDEEVHHEVPKLGGARPGVAEKRSYSRLERWKAGKGYKNNNVIKDLVQNFHWEIVRKRRSLGLSRNELAQAVGASESEMRSMEMGELPKDDFVFISKIENRLGVSLRKERAPDGVTLSDLQKMNENKVRAEIEKVQEGPLAEEEAFSGSDLEILDD